MGNVSNYLRQFPIRNSFGISFCCCIYATAFFCCPGADARAAELTICFMNPHYNCVGETYCVDVALQSDTPDLQLFGINVRFFYDDAELTFLSFGDFQGGYGALGTPTQIMGTPDSGSLLFGFSGRAAYINGAVQLVNTQVPPLYIATEGWTKLFCVYFTVTNPDKKNDVSFCPSLVWDLKAIPSEGGFSGSNGLIMTVVDSPAKNSAPADERVVQFNWEYAVSPGTPYGYPVCQIGAACGGVFPVPHPADQNADFFATLGEVIAYLSGWQQGANPMNYAIRGAFIWQNGEQYTYNADLAPPVCWVLSR